ncbi:hypothetical protein EYF80_028777 [Liparis tanakae]|uniref:Uncharacterized protein n=1 Tax=Liparis tanakae TaxID=230148 RepID=A0A4Z2H5E7_9TELE|nr:hypothetical protein EYF80_028777 [Liparis tanakae]
MTDRFRALGLGRPASPEPKHSGSPTVWTAQKNAVKSSGGGGGGLRPAERTRVGGEDDTEGRSGSSSQEAGGSCPSAATHTAEVSFKRTACLRSSRSSHSVTLRNRQPRSEWGLLLPWPNAAGLLGHESPAEPHKRSHIRARATEVSIQPQWAANAKAQADEALPSSAPQARPEVSSPSHIASLRSFSTSEDLQETGSSGLPERSAKGRLRTLRPPLESHSQLNQILVPHI